MENININIEEFNANTEMEAAQAQAVEQAQAQGTPIPVQVVEGLPSECVEENASIEINLELTAEEMQTETVSSVSVEDDEKQIASIRSAFYGGLIKVLSIVSKNLSSDNILQIKEGHILASYNGGYFFSDLTDLFNKNSWNIKDPKNAIARLNLIKGNDTVTILEAANKYIIYNESKGVIKQKTTFAKAKDSETNADIIKSDPGELKYETSLDAGIVSNLVAAKASLSALHYNIIIDVDTYEVLELNVNQEFDELLLSDAGRTTMRYKTQDLFPHASSAGNILKIYEKPDGRLCAIFKSETGVGDGMHFQTDLVKSPLNEKVNFAGI